MVWCVSIHQPTDGSVTYLLVLWREQQCEARRPLEEGACGLHLQAVLLRLGQQTQTS